METKKTGCACQHPAGACQACDAEEIFSYWCEQCERSVPEKRCLYCGLKARKKRQEPPG